MSYHLPAWPRHELTIEPQSPSLLAFFLPLSFCYCSSFLIKSLLVLAISHYPPFYSALVGPTHIAVCCAHALWETVHTVTVHFAKATLEESLDIYRLIGGAMVANSKEGGVALDLSYFLLLSDLKGAFCFLVSFSIVKIKRITSFPGWLLPEYCKSQ